MSEFVEVTFNKAEKTKIVRETETKGERKRENKFISFYVLSIRLKSLAPTNAY